MSAVANVNISDNENDEKINSGWLMKRTRVVHRWQQQWFTLKDKTLLYGDDAQHATKRIPLEAAAITECRIDNKEFAFSVRPRGSKRTYYMNASSDFDKNNWIAAIKMATGLGSEASQACVVQ